MRPKKKKKKYYTYNSIIYYIVFFLFLFFFPDAPSPCACANTKMPLPLILADLLDGLTTVLYRSICDVYIVKPSYIFAFRACSKNYNQSDVTSCIAHNLFQCRLCHLNLTVLK